MLTGGRVAVTLAVAVLFAVAPAFASATSFGIADQHSETFSTPAYARLHAAGMNGARYVTPYDTLSYVGDRRYGSRAVNLDAWMAAAHAAGTELVLSLSGRTVRPRHRPQRALRARAVDRQIDRLRARYPYVSVFSLQNEPNLGGPYQHHPEKLGRLYRHVRDHVHRTCPGCLVMPGDLSGRRGIGRYARAVRRAAREPIGVWSMTDYLDVNRHTYRAIRSLTRAVSGRVWLTETGAIYARGRVAERRTPVLANRRHAHTAERRLRYQTSATRFLLRLVRHYRRRVTRAFVYQLQARWTRGNGSWDSGLLDRRHGTPRPSFRIVLHRLTG